MPKRVSFTTKDGKQVSFVSGGKPRASRALAVADRPVPATDNPISGGNKTLLAGALAAAAAWYFFLRKPSAPAAAPPTPSYTPRGNLP